MPEVFISYSRKDKDFVASLHQALAEQQRETWLDTKDIPPTAEWLKEIFGAIEAADTFVFVISPDGILSEVCQQEIMHALKHHKRIIPVVRREVDPKTVPEPINKLNWLFFRDHDSFDNSFQALVKAINTDLEYIREHTRFLTKAIEWENREKDKGLLLRGIDLKEGEKWLAQSGDKEPRPTPLQMNYILASRQGAVRRQRTLLGAVTFGLAVAAGLAVLAFYQYQVAEKRGRIALSRQLAAQSLNLPDRDQDLRLLLSAQAVNISGTAEAKSALARNLLHNPRLLGLFEGYGKFTFSPDGKYFAYIKGPSIILVDLITRKPKHILPNKPGEEDDPHELIFSPDSKLLASRADRDINIWDVDSGKRLNQKITGSTMAWGNQPKPRLAVARQNAVEFIDAEGRVEMSLPLPRGMGRIASLTCRQDGKILAALDDKRQVFLWDAADKKSSVIPAPKSNMLIFSPAGDLLSLQKMTLPGDLSDFQVLEIFQTKVPAARPIWTAVPIPREVAERFAVGASPDGRYFALGDRENTVVVWDMIDRRVLPPVFKTPQLFKSYMASEVAFSVDGKYMASQSHLNPNIFLWDLEGSDLFCQEITGVTGDIDKLALDNAGKVLVSLSLNKNLASWGVASRKATGLKYNLPAGHEIADIIFTPADKLVALAATPESEDKRRCRLWDVQEAKFISPTLEVSGRYLSLSRDGQWLVTAREGDLELWDVQTPKRLDAIKTELAMITYPALSPDKKLLAWTSKRSGFIDLWEVQHRKLWQPPLQGVKGDPYQVKFSPDGQTLASLEGEGELILWDLATRQPWSIPLEDDMAMLTWSGDGKLLAAAGWKGKNSDPAVDIIKLYNLDIASWPGKACRVANRNLTRQEWRQYMGDLPYQPLCPGLPVPNDEPVVTQAPEKTEK
jgi:WD40 repeat protein